MNKLNYLQKYFNYKIKATNAHGIHPPFLFELYNNVIADQTPFYAFSNIESIRAKLLLSKLEIEINDFGAGSSVNKSNKRTVADIA